MTRFLNWLRAKLRALDAYSDESSKDDWDGVAGLPDDVDGDVPHPIRERDDA